VQTFNREFFMKTVSRVIIVIVVLGVVLGAAAWYVRRGGSDGPAFKTAKVETGDIVATISATGTVEPQDVIDVGAQVGGLILSFGKDESGKTIDYGSVVNQGTVLANIDPSLYTSDMAQAKAQLDQAKASKQSADANLEQLKAKLDQAQRDWTRAQKIGPSDALSQSDYDSYESAYEVAKANILVGQAAIAQAQATIESDQAAVDRATQNLGYCVIKSPVQGVIIDRRVNIGQTVVSSLSAPSLFLIAKDLKQMEIWVAVNEADIGNLHPGQPVTYTVDAFPGQTFKGEVAKIRLNATMTQNVVTYTVVVSTDNSSGKLLPYLTANVQFETARRDNVLTVPNAALRWVPAENQVDPSIRDQPPGGTKSDHQTSTTRPHHSAGTIWIESGQYVRPIPVQVGLTDGIETEIQGEGVSDGTTVVIGEQPVAAAGASDSTNPFGPPKWRQSKKK
jgi:HlyD family secretion protein